VLAWLEKWWAVLLGAVLAAVAAFLGWQHYSRKLGKLQDKLAVEQAGSAIRVLRAQRERIAEQRGETHAELVELDAAIAEQKRRIVESYSRGKELSDDEVEEALQELGLW
jgi:alkylated DNA nucleotide flippase Atl1